MSTHSNFLLSYAISLLLEYGKQHVLTNPKMSNACDLRLIVKQCFLVKIYSKSKLIFVSKCNQLYIPEQKFILFACLLMLKAIEYKQILGRPS